MRCLGNSLCVLGLALLLFIADGSTCGSDKRCLANEAEAQDDVSLLQKPVNLHSSSLQKDANSVTKPGPLLLFATHHKSGTVLARQLMHAMTEVMADSTWGPLFVRGVDWNQTGTPGELLNPPCPDKHCTRFAREPCPLLNHTGPTLGIFQNMDRPTLRRLNADCGHYRMVHLIRDPVALTVSAYLYHSRVGRDTAEPGRLSSDDQAALVSPPRVGPKVYKKLSLKDGLKHEAAMELNTTLQSMREVTDATFWRTNTMTVPLESFTDSFNEMAHKIFLFFFGEQVAEDKLVLFQKHVKELGDNRHVHWQGHEHISSEEDTAHAREAWRSYSSEESVFERVQATRKSLGYTDEGVFLQTSSLASIPSVLHQTWKTTDVPKLMSAYAATWRTLHPKWKYMFWSDDDNLRLWANESMEKLDLYNSFAEGVMRSDASRLLYLQNYGGVYADFDVEPCQNLDKLLSKWELVFVRSPLGYVSNYFIASAPFHPFWGFALDQLQDTDARLLQMKSQTEKDGGQFSSGMTVMWTAGPRFLDDAFQRFLNESTQLIKDKIKIFNFSEFQAEIGIHHWTGTWHCPVGSSNCTKSELYSPKPTEGAEKGVDTSTRCSLVHRAA
mmetsp:Transcript_134310/g.236815  ORF Transcript_134310/g.236815 Transcript_134310/m.236815 type:complete len:612 (-) Transcript_134310:69-1904(-)